MVRLAAFASKTELRKPEKRGSGLSSVERGAQPLAPQRAQTARRGPRRLRPARPVTGLRRIFRAITTACSDGFRRERAESLKKFGRLDRRDRRQALRALGWLTLARAAVRVFPYSTIRRAIDRVVPRPIVAAAMTPAECEQAVRRALRVLPSASCLAQAIAGACLLRRDGRDSTLTIGVRFDAAHRFHAHAWLESDGIIVTGRHALVEHRVLLRDAVDRTSFNICRV